MWGSVAIATCVMLKLIAEHKMHLHENVTKVRQFVKKGCADPVPKDHKGQKTLPVRKVVTKMCINTHAHVYRLTVSIRSLTGAMNIRLLTAVH